MNKDAYISHDGRYRYTLSRIWDETKPLVMFIGLNPSTADEYTDDNTIKRCCNFALSWGYGGILVGNLFAYRSTNPNNLFMVEDPIGPENDTYLKKMSMSAALIVAVWGNSGCLQNRSHVVAKMFPEMKCLRKNKTGEPAHPLYLPADLKPINF